MVALVEKANIGSVAESSSDPSPWKHWPGEKMLIFLFFNLPLPSMMARWNVHVPDPAISPATFKILFCFVFYHLLFHLYHKHHDFKR